MVLAEPCDDVDVIQEVALYFLRDLEYGEWECGRCWRSHRSSWEGEAGTWTKIRLDLHVSEMPLTSMSNKIMSSENSHKAQ